MSASDHTWVEIRVGDLGNVITGRTPPSERPGCFGDLSPFITPGDMRQGKYARRTERSLSQEGVALLDRIKLPPNAVCVSCIGWQMGEAIITDKQSFTNQQINSIIVGDGFDPSFVYYSFRTRKHELLSLGSAAGARTPILNKSAFCNLRLNVPPLPMQQRIASMLGEYDALIEVNRRRILIIEEVAQRLFEKWSVRLRVQTSGSKVQHSADWPKGILSDTADFEKGRKPKAVFSDQADEMVPQLLIDVLRGSSPKYVVPDGMVLARADDTIMVMDGSGSSEVFIGHSGAIGSTLGRYRCRPNAGLSPYWLYLLLASKTSELKTKNTGAAVPHANKDYIARIEFDLPPPDVSHRFDSIVRPMFEMISALGNANSRLAASRDLLLPRLISGKLSVSAANQELEAVA